MQNPQSTLVANDEAVAAHLELHAMAAARARWQTMIAQLTGAPASPVPSHVGATHRHSTDVGDEDDE